MQAPRLCRQLRLSNNPKLFKKIQVRSPYATNSKKNADVLISQMTIENIGQTYLDINATVSEQQDVMLLIEDEVT